MPRLQQQLRSAAIRPDEPSRRPISTTAPCSLVSDVARDRSWTNGTEPVGLRQGSSELGLERSIDDADTECVSADRPGPPIGAGAVRRAKHGR
jgi:hypothetical protein